MILMVWDFLFVFVVATVVVVVVLIFFFKCVTKSYWKLVEFSIKNLTLSQCRP